MTPRDRHPTAHAAVTVDLANGTSLSFCGHCWRVHSPAIRRNTNVARITDWRVTT